MEKKNTWETYNKTQLKEVDVFAKEPLPLDSPYLKVNDPSKILLTPHIGWASQEARICLVEKIAENIRNN